MKLRTILLAPTMLALLACGRADAPVEPGTSDGPGASSPGAPQGPKQLGRVLRASNAGGFHASWEALGGEVPLNEEFSAEFWLFEDAAGTRPILDAQVVIDCRMPAHRHGMLTDVDLVPQGGGRYLAEGMMCHMLGHWELYVDLTDGQITERVQWDLELD